MSDAKPAGQTMNVRASRGMLSVALCGVVLVSAAHAQSFGSPAQASPPVAAPGVSTPQPPGSFANPFANSLMNPYLNPYMTTQPMTRNDMLLFYMAGQQQRGGLGSTSAAGTRTPAESQPPPPAGRVAPTRPRPNTSVTVRSRASSGGPVAGRFNDSSHYYDDGRGQLAERYPAYGAVMTDAQGARMVPGLAPAPNEGVGRYFNRNPAYNRNNGR